MILLGFGLILSSMVLLGTLIAMSPQRGANIPLAAAVIPVEVRYPAPELILTNADGGSESLKDYLGYVVLVNNWATWCPPCKAEMPILTNFHEKHADDGLRIIAVNAGESREVVLEFKSEYRLPFTIWLDPEETAMKAFNNQNLPSSYILDRAGIVRYAWTGEITDELLEEYVTPLLSE